MTGEFGGAWDVAKTNPDPARFRPNDMTEPLRTLRPYEQREIVRDGRRAFDLQASATPRDVSHNAIEGAGLRDRNRATFIGPASWGPAAFHRATLGHADYKCVKLETNRR
jgi:hypothetical protein